MRWIITEDPLSTTLCPDEDGRTAVGRTRRASLNADQMVAYIALHGAELKTEFRLLDGDDQVYFIGLCEDLGNFGGDEPFAPLDLFGQHYGCISLQYRPRGSQAEWEDL